MDKEQLELNKELYLGVMQSQSVCPDCHGTGKIPEKKCKHCRGTGTAKETVEKKINVPAGIDDGQKIKICRSR